jgi:Rod binding domain-containing protein
MAAPLALPLVGSLALGAAKSLAGTTAASAAGAAASALSGADGRSKLKKTAQDFETMFLEQMVDRMTQSNETDGPLGENGTGGGVWRSMLASEYAKTIAKSGGVGIADQVMRAMLQMQASGGNG